MLVLRYIVNFPLATYRNVGIYAHMRRIDISQIINVVGGQRELAELIGVSQQTISYWKVKDMDIPAEMAVAIEKQTKGLIPRWKMRPDLWDEPSARR